MSTYSTHPSLIRDQIDDFSTLPSYQVKNNDLLLPSDSTWAIFGVSSHDDPIFLYPEYKREDEHHKVPPITKSEFYMPRTNCKSRYNQFNGYVY